MATKSGRRVAITGLGPITSIGIGKERFWRRRSRTIRHPPSTFPG